MILEYFRPKTVKEALDLHKENPNSRFLGGGTFIQNTLDDFVAIDLQLLGLNKIGRVGKTYSIGATVTLNEIYEEFEHIADLANALRIESSTNQRNRATIGGLLMTVDGRSPFLTCLVSLKSCVYSESEDNPIDINVFLRNRSQFNKLINKMEIEIPDNFGFESIARTPLDKPIVCCAVSKYTEDAMVGIGGFGLYPIHATGKSFLEMDDKNIVDAYSLVDDQWASASFRASVIKTLAKRLL